MPPLLTVVTITSNDTQGLAATLASTVALRDYADVEHIVVDGNDGDASPVVAPAGVHVIRREPRGISDAFNVGVTAARGEWLWFLNGGDTIHPEADLAFVLRALALTKSDAIIFDIEREDGIDYRPTLPEIWPPVFNWIPHPATFVRAKLVRSAGGFSTDFRIAADLDLWFRLFSRNALVDLVNHRVAQFAAGGMSSTESSLLAREDFTILWVHRKRIGCHMVRQSLLIPYRIVMAVSTTLFGQSWRWLARLSRRR